MTAALELSGLTKQFQTPTGPYIAVKNVNAQIEAKEFVCLLGHSGCGKSTVLSVIAGLEQATEGGVIINGREVDAPGLDRGVVFQAPCLLPWITAGENVRLAVGSRFPEFSAKRQKEVAREAFDLVGISDCFDQMPEELSLGTQQCVSIARALSISPSFLLLDEPFSSLDSLTRLALQDTLLEVWERTRNTVVMVTHDIDEALYLSDRIILMTDGPQAGVGKILSIPFPRPRDRAALLKSSEFYEHRSQIIDFLELHARQFSSEHSVQ
jgi:nitrate ABC transporter ATP-binding subunit